jgi:hypothetical protein
MSSTSQELSISALTDRTIPRSRRSRSPRKSIHRVSDRHLSKTRRGARNKSHRRQYPERKRSFDSPSRSSRRRGTDRLAIDYRRSSSREPRVRSPSLRERNERSRDRIRRRRFTRPVKKVVPSGRTPTDTMAVFGPDGMRLHFPRPGPPQERKFRLCFSFWFKFGLVAIAVVIVSVLLRIQGLIGTGLIIWDILLLAYNFGMSLDE